jgi:hypothetical protein
MTYQIKVTGINYIAYVIAHNFFVCFSRKWIRNTGKRRTRGGGRKMINKKKKVRKGRKLERKIFY